MSDVLTLEDFAPKAGDVFELRLPDQTVALKLHDTRKLGTAVREGGAFALYFDGPATPALPQATYALVHHELGQVDIFIVPVSRGGAGIRYEAIFT